MSLFSGVSQAQERILRAFLSFLLGIVARFPILKASTLVRLGRLQLRLGQHEGASAAYLSAIALDGSRAEWDAELAEALMLQKRWILAAAAWKAALDKDPARKDWRMRQGEALARGGDHEGARETFKRAIRGEERPLDDELLKSRERLAKFPYRRLLLEFIEQHQLPEAALDDFAVHHDALPKLYTYWDSGLETAPPVVRRCAEEMLRLDKSAVIVLNAATLPTLITMPPVSERARPFKPQHSNFIRLMLLYQYGGIWADATCLPTESVIDQFYELTGQAGFFAFRDAEHPYRLSNWFIASRPGNYVIGALLRAHMAYWSHFTAPIEYHFFHHLFEGLYHTDSKFRAIVGRSMVIDRRVPHALQRVLHEELTAEVVEGLLSSCFIHKLTHKLDGKEFSQESVLRRFVLRPPK